MKICTIRDLLDARVLTGEDRMGEHVYSACGSDMMSDVLAYVKDQAVLLTGLVNAQVIRTAEMMDMHCIVFVRSKEPTEDMLRLAEENGMVLLAFANGLDRSRVAKQDYEPPMKSVGHGITTMQDLENNAEVWRIMLALTQDIGKKLRLYNKNAGGVAIYIRYVQDKQIAGKQWQCQLPMRTHSAAIIAREAYGLFERNYRWEYPVRSVTVRAINLCSQDEPEQIGFFMNPQEVDRRERLETAIEEIRDRFGKYAIQPACLCQQIKMPTDREVELRMPTGLFN